jgi:hypothetical protein
MLEGNFVEFLETQFKMYEGTIDKEEQLVIDEIKEARTGDKIIELSQEKCHADFQMITHLYRSLPVKKPNGFSDRIDVNYHMMAFFLERANRIFFRGS